jgi:hypothetical protein
MIFDGFNQLWYFIHRMDLQRRNRVDKQETPEVVGVEPRCLKENDVFLLLNEVVDSGREFMEHCRNLHAEDVVERWCGADEGLT